MVLQLKNNLAIENLRAYPRETVEELRALLATGALAHADPRHKNFYELDGGATIFYVHVAPSQKVLLLATWPKQDPHLTKAERAAGCATT